MLTAQKNFISVKNKRRLRKYKFRLTHMKGFGEGFVTSILWLNLVLFDAQKVHFKLNSLLASFCRQSLQRSLCPYTVLRSNRSKSKWRKATAPRDRKHSKLIECKTNGMLHQERPNKFSCKQCQKTIWAASRIQNFLLMKSNQFVAKFVSSSRDGGFDHFGCSCPCLIPPQKSFGFSE